MQTPAVARNHYNELKTFGVGKDVSVRDWQTYLLQMLQMGFFEVAYNMHNQMKVTPLGWKVLKGEHQVSLAIMENKEEEPEEEQEELDLQEELDMETDRIPTVIFLSEIITSQWCMQSV